MQPAFFSPRPAQVSLVSCSFERFCQPVGGNRTPVLLATPSFLAFLPTQHFPRRVFGLHLNRSSPSHAQKLSHPCFVLFTAPFFMGPLRFRHLASCWHEFGGTVGLVLITREIDTYRRVPQQSCHRKCWRVSVKNVYKGEINTARHEEGE